MKPGYPINLLLFFALLLIGCANQSAIMPTSTLSIETTIPVITPTLPIHPTETNSPESVPSENPSVEKLVTLPSLSLPEFNARYSTGDMTLSSDKKLMAVVSENKQYGTQGVWIWNVDDLNQSSFGYQVNVEKLWSVAFNLQGNLLAVGGTEKIIIFDWQTGDILNTIPIPNSEPVQLVFGPNNSMVWSAFNNQVTVSNLSSGEVKYSVEGITGFEPNNFALRPDGKVLVTGTYQGINLWDFETGQTLGFQEGPEGGIGIAPATAFSDSGQFLAATGCRTNASEGCAVGNVILWKSDLTDPSVMFDLPFGWIKALAFSPDEGTIATVSADDSIALINLGDGTTLVAPSMEMFGQLPPDDLLLIKDIAFSPIGNLLIISATDGIQFLNMSTMSWMPNLRFILSLGYQYSIIPEGDNLNFRTEPSLNAEIIKKLHTGESFGVIDGPKVVDDQIWWKVKIEDDTEGWIVEMRGWYEFVP